MERLEKVVVLDNEVLAELVDSILTEREIPHLMRSYRDSVYDGLFQTAAGWGHIEAPPSFMHKSWRCLTKSSSMRSRSPTRGTAV